MDLVLRAAVGFVFLLFVIRVTGRRELSSMEPFDLIMLVVLGDLVQQGITQSDYSITGALLVISVMALLTALVSFLNARFRWVRPVLEGRPVVLIERGRVLEGNVRRERLTVAELEEQARQQQIASRVIDVRVALTAGPMVGVVSEPERFFQQRISPDESRRGGDGSSHWSLLTQAWSVDAPDNRTFTSRVVRDGL